MGLPEDGNDGSWTGVTWRVDGIGDWVLGVIKVMPPTLSFLWGSRLVSGGVAWSLLIFVGATGIVRDDGAAGGNFWETNTDG